MKDDWLGVRLRARDWDIKEELQRRQLASGELSELMRDGLRLVLFGRGQSRWRLGRKHFNDVSPLAPSSSEISGE